MSSTLAAFRPTDESVSAVLVAIAATTAEREAAAKRLGELRQARAAALLDPEVSGKQIAALEAEAQQSAIQIDRMDALKPVLETKLAEAQKAEQKAEIDGHIQVAVEAIEKYKLVVKNYAEHARQIAEICQVNQDMLTAINLARRAAGPGCMSHFGWYPAFHGRELANLVVLPGWWGETPPIRGPYSPVPVVV